MLTETLFFFSSVLYGLQMFLFYDLFRALRRTWPHKQILIAIEDISFWIAASIFLFTRVYKWNNGTLRWFFFVGLGLGTLLYYVVFSPYVLKFVCFLLKWLKMCISWVNILGKGAVTRIFRISGIKYGENVKKKEAQNTKQSNETE